MDEKGNKKYFKNKDFVSFKKGDKMAEQENNKIKIQHPQNQRKQESRETMEKTDLAKLSKIQLLWEKIGEFFFFFFQTWKLKRTKKAPDHNCDKLLG